MRGDTCHCVKPVRGTAIMNAHKPLHPSYGGTKSEPAGGRKAFKPIIPDEKIERPIMLSQTTHGCTCDGKMHSSMRELAVDPDHEELRKALKKQSGLRDTLYGRRLQLKEKRNELRQERDLLADADDNFMKSLRRIPEQDHFELDDGQYFQLEQQRDLVGSLQYEYDQAEDEHDIAESELDNEEGKLNVLLSKLLNEHSNTGDDHTTETSLDSHPQSEELQYANEEDEARAGLAEYQSRVGDARIMEERLQELYSEQGERHSFAKRRENLGVDLASSNEDFTEYFKYRSSEIVGELDIIYADIERLKDGLIQAGHVFPKANATDRPPEVLADQAQLRPHPAYYPVARRMPLSRNILQSLQKTVATTGAHINRWLLNIFGNSPVECARHKEILRRLGDESLDEEKWARLVLRYWEKAECHDGDDSSRGSWDEISPRDFIENLVLLSGRSEATHAMNDFKQQFPLHTPGNHSRPYATEVELDKLSE